LLENKLNISKSIEGILNYQTSCNDCPEHLSKSLQTSWTQTDETEKPIENSIRSNTRPMENGIQHLISQEIISEIYNSLVESASSTEEEKNQIIESIVSNAQAI